MGHRPFAICLLQFSLQILLLLYHAELLIISLLHLAASVPLHIHIKWVAGMASASLVMTCHEPGTTSGLIWGKGENVHRNV